MRVKSRFLMLILSAVVLLGMPVNSHAAEGSWWDVFFPTYRNVPAETLQAPFADADAVIVEPEGDSVLALNVRHRQNVDITEWVEHRVSELVIYSAKNYQTEYKENVKDFDAVGTSEYLKFLQDNNILKPLSTGSYDVKGFAKDLPNILNEGALNGRYRWLLQVPVMVTFVKTGLNDYKFSKPDETLTTEYIINLQVGRSNASMNDLGILIESWKATPVKRTQ